MTQSFATNANNDIYIGSNGNLAVLSGQAAVEAACANVSKASLGEEVLSINTGIPFFQAVFTGVPNIAIFQNYLRQALLSIDGVVNVTSIVSKVQNHVLSYEATIESQYGQTAVIADEFPIGGTA